jgi:hypothetical protein
MANNKKKDNNDVVILKLDRAREVRFTHKALKRLCSMLNKEMTEVIQTALTDIYNKTEIYAICGLMKDAEVNGEHYNLEQIEDLIDKAPYHEVVAALSEAFAKGIGYEDEVVEEVKEEDEGKN